MADYNAPGWVLVAGEWRWTGAGTPTEAAVALPPLGDAQAAMDMTCAYGIPPTCSRRATWHVIWTPDGENSIGCDEHAQEAEKRWTRYDRHPLTETCGMPDSNIIWSWDEAPGRCVWVVSEETLALAEAAKATWATDCVSCNERIEIDQAVRVSEGFTIHAGCP